MRATINHPPAFNFTDRAYPLHPNRRFDAKLQANDADGDILHYTAEKLPPGATFDEKSGRITWVPTAQQVRQHTVDITASDGCAEAKTTVFLDVRTNRTPTTRQHDLIVLIPGDDTDSGDAVVANDPDSDELSATPIEMPQGAELLARASQVVLHWRPTDADIGQHPLVFTLSDGQTGATIHNTIEVVPRRDADEWGRALLPGIGPTSFLTHAHPELFAGGAFDVSIYAQRQSAQRGLLCVYDRARDSCHASHRRFYAQMEVLSSTHSHTPALFTYGLGFSSSFEWYPARRYLIPHYGVEAGGLYRNGLGHRMATRPYLGAHLWASDTLWVTATLGYRIVPAELHNFSGPTFALTAIFNPW